MEIRRFVDINFVNFTIINTRVLVSFNLLTSLICIYTYAVVVT